jgi:hypothetical protein
MPRSLILTGILLASTALAQQSTPPPTSQVPDLRHGTLDSFIGTTRLLLLIDMHADDRMLTAEWTSLAKNSADLNKRNVTVVPILIITAVALPPRQGLHTEVLSDEGMTNARARFHCSDVDFCVVLIDVDGAVLLQSTVTVPATDIIKKIDDVNASKVLAR